MVILFDIFHLPDDVFSIVFATDQQVAVAKMLVIEIKEHGGELGKTEMLMRDVLALTPGAIIELDSLAGEPVRITVRGKIIAYGEVVVVDENFGVKITRIASTQDKIQSIG